MMPSSRYTVMLPVCHGGRFLEKALTSLADVFAPEGGYDVIIAGRKKDAADIFKRRALTHWILVESNGNRSCALNAACHAAKGAYWVFSDDDCVFPADWLLNLDRSLAEHPEAAVVGGADRPTGFGTDFDAALDAVLNSWMGTGGTRTDRAFKTGVYYPKLWNMAVRADAARKVAPDGPGGLLIFDPALPVHEDVDLVDRIRSTNGEVVYAPSVCVEHSRDTTYGAFVRRNLAMAHMCRKHGIHRLPHLALVATLAGIPFTGILSLFMPALQIFAGSAFGLYTGAVLLTGIKGAMKKKRKTLSFWIPALLVSMQAARAAGFLLPPRTGYGRNV
jgi:GT2 family glycosyltransferase